MAARHRITDEQRRARAVSRQHLARTAVDVVDAVRAVVALHSSDPVTPHLGLWARVPSYETAHLDDALCETRSLWRMHAMRRTLFIVPSDEGPVFEGAASRDIAVKERRKLEQWLGAEMDPADVQGWLADVAQRTLAVLDGREDWRTQELTAALPALGTEITLGTGKWTTRAPLSSRLLFLLAMEGHIVRTSPAGSWRSSQYRWASAPAWFGSPLQRMDAEDARAALARRYLTTHGPATVADVRWWTGWTARQTAAALDALGVVAVDLDGGAEGIVLAEDTVTEPADGPSVALLPGLDPATMGWKERSWYLGEDDKVTAALFDRNGNAGPTVWVDGRVVGGWGQRPDGEVVTRLLIDVGADRRALVEAEAGALTSWLDGVVVSPRFRVPLERELSAT